jgi:hypothetical protein
LSWHRRGGRFSFPACTRTQRQSQRPSREARSRAEPRAAATLRRAWRARRALDLDGHCDWCNARSGWVRPNFRFRFPNPYSHREAEAGSPSKSVTATPSISELRP